MASILRQVSILRLVQSIPIHIASIVGIARAGLHAFRHTCASLLVEQGISMRIAQQQLRHSDPRITLAIYSQVIGDSHRQAVEKLSSVLDVCWPQLATNGDEQNVKGQFDSVRLLVVAVGIELLFHFTKSRVFTVLPTASQINWSQMELI